MNQMPQATRNYICCQDPFVFVLCLEFGDRVDWSGVCFHSFLCIVHFENSDDYSSATQYAVLLLLCAN
jgi:hypothetical protein